MAIKYLMNMDHRENFPGYNQDIEIMELDELCTFVKKDQRTEENTSSYGLLLIDQQIKLLILKQETERSELT